MPNPRSAAAEFESITKELLGLRGLQLRDDGPPGKKGTGYDFAGNYLEKKWLVECKYYRSAHPSLGLIRGAATQLALAGVAWGGANTKAFLAVSGYVDSTSRAAIQDECGIIILDRADLFALCIGSTLLRERLDAILEPSPFDFAENATQPSLEGIAKRYWHLEPYFVLIPEPEGTEAQASEHTLVTELNSVERGRGSWRQYEQVCKKILQHLFEPDLTSWTEQIRTEDDLQRFDLVCKIRSNNEFWRFIVDQVNSRYILFEFKNYTDAIGQSEIITTERYLFEMALRKVAFVVTRVDASESANQVRRGAMREHGKLIIVLTDADLEKMLEMKQSNSDPTDHLFELVDTFLLTLTR